MYKYKVITNPHLEEYLHNKGFIPVMTNPIANTKDSWKYTFEYTAQLQIEIDNYYTEYFRIKKLKELQWHQLTGI